MSIQSLSFYQQDQNYWNRSQSFYQQDQNYWSQAHAQSQASSADAALINVMAQAETNLGKGLASIANGEALTRVNSQLTAAIQSVLQGSSASSTSSSSASSTASSASLATASAAASPNSSGAPATGIGTVPVTTNTPLSTLGFLPGGTIDVGDGTNVTKYTSTGTDTVGSLISAINSGSAFVAASINANGNLTITARNSKLSVIISGSGNDAAAIGFGTNNNTFQPTPPSAATTPAAASSPSASSAGNASTSSTTTKSSTASATGTSAVQTMLSLNASSAASILSASGVSGTLVDLLA